MAHGSGIASQVGFKAESTYGTGVTVDRFVPCSAAPFTLDQPRIEDDGIRAGRLLLEEDDFYLGNKRVSGTINTRMYDRDVALLFQHALGGVSHSGSGPYTHTITPADLTGKGLTVQLGVPLVGGTVHPMTYTGCKVKALEIACVQGELATLAVELVGQDEDSDGTPSLASASYNAVRAYSFADGAVTVAGSAVKVRSFRWRWENMFADRFNIGSRLTEEPKQNDLSVCSGEFLAEWSTAQYGRFTGGTTSALVLAFSSGSYSITITMNVRYDGSTPQISGRGLVETSSPFKAVGDGSDSDAVTVVIVDSQATG